MIKQIRFITKQYNILPSWFGGLIVVHLEVFALFTLINFAGICDMVWLNHPNWHPYFLNNYFVFIFSFIVPFEVGALLYYKFLVHAKQKYQQYQAYTSERNPAFQKLIEIERNQKKIMEKLGIEKE